jgi:prohibitin 2
MFNKVKGWVDRHFIAVSTTVLVVFFLLFFFAKNIFITIPAGHGGALWLRFFHGSVLNFSYGEGTKVIFPWDKIFIYDMRVQQLSDRFDVLTKEGLQVSVYATVRYRLNPDALGAITAYAGPDFASSLVMPSVGGVLRQESAKYSLDDIYSSRRREIELSILEQISRTIAVLIPTELHEGPEILVQDFWFRSIQLPPQLQSAIEAKLTQRQIAEQYVFILQREQQERERKIIEAEGIKAFQDIVSSGISENYLRWKGIDATLKLADSTNSKIVVIGGKEGLPLILGPWENSAGRPGTLETGPAPSPASEMGPAAAAASQATMVRSSSAVGPKTEKGAAEPPNALLIAPDLPTEPLALDPRTSMPPRPLESR